MACAYIDANGWSNDIDVWDDVKEEKYESYVSQMENGIRDVAVDELDLITEMENFQKRYEDFITESMELPDDEFYLWIEKDGDSVTNAFKDEL